MRRLVLLVVLAALSPTATAIPQPQGERWCEEEEVVVQDGASWSESRSHDCGRWSTLYALTVLAPGIDVDAREGCGDRRSWESKTTHAEREDESGYTWEDSDAGASEAWDRCMALFSVQGTRVVYEDGCGAREAHSSNQSRFVGGGEDQGAYDFQGSSEEGCATRASAGDDISVGQQAGCNSSIRESAASSKVGGWNTSQSRQESACADELAFAASSAGSIAVGAWSRETRTCYKPANGDTQCHSSRVEEEGVRVRVGDARVLVGARSEETSVCDAAGCFESDAHGQGVFVTLLDGDEHHVPLGLP